MLWWVPLPITTIRCWARVSSRIATAQPTTNLEVECSPALPKTKPFKFSKRKEASKGSTSWTKTTPCLLNSVCISNNRVYRRSNCLIRLCSRIIVCSCRPHRTITTCSRITKMEVLHSTPFTKYCHPCKSTRQIWCRADWAAASQWSKVAPGLIRAKMPETSLSAQSLIILQ